MRFLPCADQGLLVGTGSLDEALALYRALAAGLPPGVEDLVPAARTVLLRLAPGADPARVERHVRRLELSGTPTGRGELVRIPVVYDGEDLPRVAELTGLPAREVVRLHTGREWTVAFGGFAPGFGYLIGGAPELAVPRRAESRTRVPAGAVGLAGEFSGVYPRPSPGGWQLIGRTRLEMWREDRTPPALLRPGVRVRFEEVGRP
ncbi:MULTISPECIES: 5-oxoprolinase subunit B family protein [Streptomyces]|uniref:Carboxyltransferase domain-containing protein n=4 Tax=Streptomyces TaxID=1883 RepID=A0A8H9HLM6_9ACTN|nr:MULTISPECIES: allophanate hydrolase subunit 1 [Streptomyces]NEC14308.1 allophanate hydrolase subunit 1 [Streptomyces sp. SID8014]NEE27377.1 allophanate hydrolase subunit 1 [Streptomyces sp. SID7982]MBL3808061.1 allophanate hydrolase subunit 1 [Streptomyces sp. BRB081]MDQ0297214.1 KipI family sensor histidine kinase inhibitor [Streptomyces sp. DSM 41037]PJM82827.1 allophanate hydrolase [Streptomyces sp. TSRI0384-2]